MKKTTLLLVFVISIAIVWYVSRPGANAQETKSPQEDLAVVIDNSTSQQLNCDALAKLTTDTLKSMDIGKRSRVTLFTLGGPDSSWEPQARLNVAAPRPGKSNFGGSFESDVQHICEKFPQVSASSIFRAIQVALEHLHGESGRGTLLVQSDGEENVSLHQFRAGKGTLPNDRIRVIWCGWASTEGGGGPRGERADALQAKWRGLFADTSNIVFKPFCLGSDAARPAQRQ